MRNSYTKSRGRFKYFLAVCVLAVIGCGAYFFLDDLDGPVISFSPSSEHIASTQDVTLTLADAASDIKSVKVVVREKDGVVTLLDSSFNTAEPKQTVTIDLQKAGLGDGPFELEVTAADTAMAGFGRGNVTTVVRKLYYDTKPPIVTVDSTAPNLRRGSTTAIAYRVSEEVQSTGVQVGDIFFPAFKQDNGLYYCFFAFPVHVEPDQFVPMVVATDLAGHTSKRSTRVNARNVAYRSDTMNISDGFLERKFPVLQQIRPETTTPLDAYIAVNRLERKKNEAALFELAQKTSPKMLWEGSFARLGGSATMALYGDKRTYFYNGQEIDRQTHMGIDLASVAKAPIPASNSGIVVFADEMGMFGKLVVIDHGLGLMSLYSHMTDIAVIEGQEVKKGDILGTTGTTGLAGGDHLHFGMLVHGLQVQPIDWFDGKWIKDTITDRLAAAGS